VPGVLRELGLLAIPVALVGGRYSITLSRYQQFRLDRPPAGPT
jgi:hypothetical protein